MEFKIDEVSDLIPGIVIFLLFLICIYAGYRFRSWEQKSLPQRPVVELLDRDQLKELMTMYMDIVKTLLSLVTLVAGGVVTLYLQTSKTKTSWFAFGAGVILVLVFLYVMTLALNKWAIYTVNYKKAKPTGK